MKLAYKIGIGAAAALVWVLAEVAKFSNPDFDIAGITLMCQSILVGLGVQHLASGSNDKSETDKDKGESK